MADIDEAAWGRLAATVQGIARRAHVMALRQSEVDLLPRNTEEALRYILENPGCRVQDIAKALLLAHANASAATRQLVALGLVSKQPDPEDRRAVRLTATQKAIEGRTAVTKVWAQIYRECATGLTEAEVQQVFDAMPVLQQMAERLAEH